MDKRIIKSALVFFMATICGFITPVLGQWYEQQTGIYPIASYLILGLGTFFTVIFSLLKIWGEIK